MSNIAFSYSPLTGRVIFGAGCLGLLAEEIGKLGYRRALVLCTPQQREQAERVATLLGSQAVGVCDRAAMHVPIEVAREAIAEAARLRADCAVAIGGGSTVGLGKAIALESSIPVVAIPTTYAGSEVTPIYGITEGGLKKTGRDIRVLPRLVIYDPHLTLSLPDRLGITSGINAIAHAVEALYAVDGNPVTSLMAEEGIRALANGLPKIHADPADLEARTQCLYGAWLCGSVLGATSMALHHKLCHTLGGTFNLPHAETHTIVLPHAVAFNRSATPEAMSRIERALVCKDAATGLWDLAKACSAPLALRDIGMPQEGIARAVDLALQKPYANPSPINRIGLTELLSKAWAGERPSEAG
ncbi:MAG: maleylacetate reductase [Panacagrimonas sp.]